MLRRLYFLIVKELITIWSDKKSRFVLIGPILIQLVVFSYAITLEVKNVSIGILDKDGGGAAHELVQRFKGSKTFTKIHYLRGFHEIRQLIDDQEVQLVVQIPQDFSRLVEAGKPAQLQFILDGRRSNSAQIIEGYAADIVNQFCRDLAQEKGIAGRPPAELIVRNAYNPNLEYQWFTIPCLCAILPMLISLLLTSLSVSRERELGTFDQLLVSPLQPIEILIGKTIPAVIFGLFEGTLVTFAAVIVFRIPLTGSLVLLYASMTVFLLSVSGIGLFISSISMTQQQAILGSFVFLVPANLLSGFATPVENIPDWLQPVSMALPLRYFLVITKGIFMKDLGASGVWHETWPMMIIAVFTLAAAAWLFRKRLE
jgi:ABC-2 type transport system permease protein